jgi:hypothetical protein
MPVMPDEATWSIKRNATDATSASLQADPTSGSLQMMNRAKPAERAANRGQMRFAEVVGLFEKVGRFGTNRTIKKVKPTSSEYNRHIPPRTMRCFYDCAAQSFCVRAQTRFEQIADPNYFLILFFENALRYFSDLLA